MPGPVAGVARAPSVFLEYGHTWWGDATVNRPAASSGFNYTWSRDSDIVKGGLRVRF